MRSIINRLLKKQKKATKDLDPRVLKSKEFQALQNMNYIMNFYDNIEKLGYDSLDGDELYIHARFQAHAFMESLLAQLSPAESSENGATSTTTV